MEKSLNERLAERASAEARATKAMGLLLSRASLLTKLGKVGYVSTFLYSGSLNFKLQFKDEDFAHELDFNSYDEDKAYDEDAINALLQLMDEAIAAIRKEATCTINTINNWEA
jgi:hypothetical protein